MTSRKAQSVEQFLSGLAENNIRYVYAGLFDQDGTWRGKKIPLPQFSEFALKGWSFIDALPWWGPNDTVRVDKAFRSESCSFDSKSLRKYPFEADSVIVVADYEGPSKKVSPRAMLQKQIKKAERMGFSALGASEFEFIILDQTASELQEEGYQKLKSYSPENRCWSAMLPSISAELLAGYEETLRNGDIELHHMCSELGPGCLEATMPARSLLRAADDAAFFKMFTRAFFSREQKTASFMAQLSDDHPGLGGHPIISLQDKNSGQAVLFGSGPKPKLTRLGRCFVAGILRLIPELTALYAPNVNSYRRYAPGNWAPRTATWGYDNYTCGLRLVASPIENARIEFRLPGADINPFLAFSMMLGAGLYGIEQELMLPPETTGIGRDKVPSDIGAVPRSLLEAAELMGQSQAAERIFGKDFIAHSVACCIDEDERMRRHVSAFERERYLFHV